MSHAPSVNFERPAEPDENPLRPMRPEIAPLPETPEEPTIPYRVTPEQPEIFPQRSPSIHPDEAPLEIPEINLS